jgi:hypothetical protein
MKRHYIKFLEEAEALGIATKIHHTNYISREINCPSGKDTYLTYERAKKALKMREYSDKTIYKCDICGHYHFTTKDGKSRKPISYSRTQEKNKFNSAILILENQEIYTTDRKTKKKSKVILYQYKK